MALLTHKAIVDYEAQTGTIHDYDRIADEPLTPLSRLRGLFAKLQKYYHQRRSRRSGRFEHQ